MIRSDQTPQLASFVTEKQQCDSKGLLGRRKLNSGLLYTVIQLIRMKLGVMNNYNGRLKAIYEKQSRVSAGTICEKGLL